LVDSWVIYAFSYKRYTILKYWIKTLIYCLFYTLISEVRIRQIFDKYADIKARDARKITTTEMKYMRRTAGYTWRDHKTNTQITKELKITQILDKLLEYKRN
jgi:hypothetical protein